MQKKNSVVVLAPPSSQKPRSDMHPMSAPHQSTVTNDQESNGIPNLESTLPQEGTFT
jgi:hypothetical protein